MQGKPWTFGKECWAELDGCGMRYLKVSPPEREEITQTPIVLLHGLLAYSFSWRHNLEVFARNRVVYALDLPGTGFSERPARGRVAFDMCSSAERLLSWMCSLGLANVNLVGTSHGGALALMMAALDCQQRSDLIGRLILIAPANPFSKVGCKRLWFFRTAFGAWLGRIGIGRFPVFNKLSLWNMYGDYSKLTKETISGYVSAISVTGTADYALAVVNSWTEDMRSLENSLEFITRIPILLVWGEKDRVVPLRSGALLQERLPGSKLVTISGAGHLPYEESPEEFNRVVLEFLNQNRGVCIPGEVTEKC